MSDIVEFLRARLDEDEAAAAHMDCPCAQDAALAPDCPERVQREAAAKRAILAIHEYEWLGPDDAAWKGCPLDVEEWPCRTVRVLAAVYSDHPDYDPKWRA